MASNLSAVARGVGAAGSANQRAGRATSPSYGQMSPLVQQYNEWSFGRPTGIALPRDPLAFTSGAFGPLDPIVPVGIDTPPEGSERPMPRRWEYSVGWNMPVGQPGTEGLKIATFATLRSFADLYSVIRACITHTVNDVLGTEWDITPTPQAEKAMHGNQKKQDDFAHRRQQAMKFWSRPDPQYRDWASWMKAVMEDHTVLDAIALYLHPTRAQGHGPFNSNLASLDLIDGSTIRPLVDMRGSTPLGENVAFQQYVWGVPRVDMMTPLMGDEDGVRTQWVKDYRGDQLVYMPYTPRAWTPYGFCYDSATEILTNEGWKFFKDLTGDEDVATRSEDGHFEWQRPDAYVNESYSGPMVEFRSQVFDLVVTPNHRMLVQRRSKSERSAPELPEIKTARWFAERPGRAMNWQIPTTSTWKGSAPEVVVIPADTPAPGRHHPAPELRIPATTWMRFLGWFLSEGSLVAEDRSTKNEVTISQLADKYRPDIRRVLAEMGVHWRESKNGFQFTHGPLARMLREECYTDCAHKAWHKRVPNRVKGYTSDLLAEMFDAMMCGDGHVEKTGLRRYLTTSPQLADDTLEVLQKMGMQGWYTTTAATGLGKHPQYHITERPGSAGSVPTPHETTYSGTIHCVSVPNGVVYVRRNGRTAWCGNSNVERALIPAATGLRRQIYAMQYYTEGTIPAVYVTPGPEIGTPTQIADLQRALNNIAGDQAWKHRVIVLPPGSKTDPQKTINLADQFDQVLAAEITMAFEMTPMDIGITPRISAVQSPSETKEFSQINAQKAQKKGLMPRLNFFKSLFDFIIQRVWGQDDMMWKWTGIETGDDLQVKVDVWTQLVKCGIASIDQAAAEFGIDPWGLPETTQPILITSTGPVKLSGGLDPDQKVAEPAAPVDVEQARLGRSNTHTTVSGVTNPKPQPKPQTTAPATPAKAGAPAVVTPAHHSARHAEGKPKPTHPEAVKAAEAELEALVRHIRKGRTVDDWVPKALSPRVMRAFQTEVDLDVAITKARGVIHALAQLARRSRLLEPIVNWLAKRLARLALLLRGGQISTPRFVDEATKIMEHGYQLVTETASKHAHDSYPDTPVVDFESFSGDLAYEQTLYLQRLMPVVLGSDDITALADRLASYSDSLVGAYNQAYGETVQRSHPDYEIIWHLGETEHCGLCLARDGKSYTFETIPGWPGDGGFGGPLCEGGPRCGCWLEYRENGETVAVAGNLGREAAGQHARAQNQAARERRRTAQEERTAFVATLPTEPGPAGDSVQTRAMTRDALRREVADLVNQRIRATGGYQGVSVEPQDIPASIIARLLPPEMQGQYRGPQISLADAVAEMFQGKAALTTLDMTHDDFTLLVMRAVVDMMKSPKTPYYSVTHNPLGVEGLWHYEGLELPAYIQQVAHGIMENGHDRASAIPMAINAIKRWAAGEGDVHPEVRAASGKALAEWNRLKATHNKTKEGR